jgi:hypothetical protein
MAEVTPSVEPQAQSHGGEDDRDGQQDPHLAMLRSRIADLDQRPVDEHPGVYAEIDDRLREALDTDQETA